MFLGDLLAQHPEPQNRYQWAAQSSKQLRQKHNEHHPVMSQTWPSLENCREVEWFKWVDLQWPSWTMFPPLHFPPLSTYFHLRSYFSPCLVASGSWVSNCPTGSSCVPSRWTLCWTQWWWVEAATPMIENLLRNISSTVTWLPTWGSNHLAVCFSIAFNQCCWTMFNGCFSCVYLRTIRNDLMQHYMWCLQTLIQLDICCKKNMICMTDESMSAADGLQVGSDLNYIVWLPLISINYIYIYTYMKDH